MRKPWPIAALVMLSACGQAPVPAAPERAGSVSESAGSDAALAAPSAAFDYRYAFRLPAGRIAAVQESHARGCDRLGAARCRITAMRYSVGRDNTVAAVLAMKLDPTLARAYGGAAAGTVTGARGVLIDADIAGADSAMASAHTDTALARLRSELASIDAQLQQETDPDQRVLLAGREARLRAALDTIGEVDRSAGATDATTPVIFTYASGTAIAGLGGSAEASFDAAGQTLLQSLGGLAVLLAGVGPWLVFLVGGALLLRYVIQRSEPPAAAIPPIARDEDGDRNVIQRWFGRDVHREREHID